jgi:Tfp pilus assembly protein PilN
VREVEAVRELEFLPADYIRARFQRRIGFIRSWLLLALGLAMVLWSLQMGAWVRDAKAELAALQGTGSAVDADVIRVRTQRAEAESYNRRIECLQALWPQLTASKVMTSLAELLPAGAVLDEVTLDQPEPTGRSHATLRVVGTAQNEAAVMRVLILIEELPLFERVTLVESKPVTSADVGRRSFVIEASVSATALPKE